ncbi:unnamed protein product [Caenorhabditis angaria]|uniref:MYND-type domain-containing protein n=1 Tax=Caenorhabditis angaria TaxID=860376 RepID=A0A9P1N0X4_9PELO|nr:unnamed protein product [Caenorhabditis angaria]
MALIPELIEPSAYAIALSKEQCLSYCNYCIRRDVAELKKCAACRSLVYCSTDCQKKDWRQHKWECKAIKAKSAICDDGHRLVARLIALVNDGDFGEVQGSGKSAGAENRSILTLQEREGDPNGEAATFLREFREFFDGAGRIEEEKVEK